ncbi:alpha/beta hydrolase [Enterococcus sp. 10A9_DIV0425]|uniref:Alpha/beta hydrolase n=1 Tax=Candidatus Enterococcus wittei TaxID=1987383 RepID=A0A2C9XPP2_9ENTE|nr:alpha/beta hydrolase [Enterococcus sp. 10A9_DIV0425]OTP12175.1 alpha/beta hydrolase [Enterococcus sp. 10A9_DIV0425]THE16149.1 alpha/beta hydrolase [Enterococcus hirae]
MEKERKYAKMSDGTEIYYEKSGHGFPLFLLHGNDGSGRFFSEQVPLLEQHFTVYLVDSRGHGHSTNEAGTLNFRLMAEDLSTLMFLEGITKADFLGFSDGANLALVFSSHYPEKVHRLILNSGNTLLSGVLWSARLLTALHYLLIWVCALVHPRFRQNLLVINLLLHDIGISTEDLENIKSPTMIIVGKKDVIKLKHSLYLAKTIPNASFVIVKGQGHQLARKDPKRFNQEVLNFLTE